MTRNRDKAHEEQGQTTKDPHAPARSADRENNEHNDPRHDQAASEKLAKLEAENKSLQDRLLRALAEIENVRKRAERDVSDARQYAVTQFARDMTRVADNLERAIGSIPQDIRRSEGPIRTLIEGVELTEKELLRSLEKHGVAKLDPAGKAFDPNFHEAIFETEDPSVPHGTVTMVAEPGYSIGARPLRPAKVAVSRGGSPRRPQS
ncbi:MAG: nucleotide exchange factor GrpE [Rhizobium sp.]